MNCSRPGSSVHGFSQAGKLEWVATSFSRGILIHRDQIWVLSPELAGRFFTNEPPRKPLGIYLYESVRQVYGPWFSLVTTKIWKYTCLARVINNKWKELMASFDLDDCTLLLGMDSELDLRRTMCSSFSFFKDVSSSASVVHFVCHILKYEFPVLSLWFFQLRLYLPLGDSSQSYGFKRPL